MMHLHKFNYAKKRLPILMSTEDNAQLSVAKSTTYKSKISYPELQSESEKQTAL